MTTPWPFKGLAKLGAVVSLIDFALSVERAPASATTITFTTAPASLDAVGDPVSAKAVFTTGTNSLTILLTNLTTPMKNAGQLLSDLFFTFNTGQTTGTLSAGPSATLRTVASHPGTFTDASGLAQWGLNTGVSGGLEICIIGPGNCSVSHVTPSHTLIGPPDSGPGTYFAANSSIVGNGPHNPFLAGTVEFDLTVPGLTAASNVASATFSFGTLAGDDIPGVGAPEPGTMLLVGLGLAGIWGIVVLRRKRSRE